MSTSNDSTTQEFITEHYFTFGYGQSPYDQHHYHLIQAESAERAREIMIERFGQRWSHQYDSDKGRRVVEDWNLIEGVWPIPEDVDVDKPSGGHPDEAEHERLTEERLYGGE